MKCARLVCVYKRVCRVVPGSVLTIALATLATVAAGCGGGAQANTPTEKKVSPFATSPKIHQSVTASQIVGAVGSDENALLGRSIAVGDFNGDGRADIAAGIPGANGNRGAVALIYGDSNGMDLDNPDLYTRSRLTQDFFTGFGSALQGDQFGFSVATGDFDNDGLDDLAIGAPFRDEGGQIEAGKVFVAFGNRSRGPSAMTIRRLTFTQTGAGSNQDGDHFGWSLVAGDFDGDQFDDLAVGAPDEDDEGAGQENSGAVFIRYGSANGLKSENYRFITAQRANNGGNATQANERFGVALAAGQLHSNATVHRANLVVGAPGRDFTRYSATMRRYYTELDLGRVYVFYQSSQDRAFTHVQDLHSSGSPVGPTGFGSSLAVGDFNGNGRLDLVVGAPQYQEGEGTGSIYVLYADGNTAYLGRADDPNLPWDRKANRKFDQSPIANNERDDLYGYALVAADFNQDGFADLAVGAPGENWQGATDTGLVFIFIGGRDGLANPFGCRYFFIDQENRGSNEENDNFGYALGAGDVTGDGLPDLVIGAPYENKDGVVNVGGVFLAKTTAFTQGPFAGTWTGTITGDNHTSATITVSLCDVDGIVSGSARLSNSIEFVRCTDLIPGYEPPPSAVSGTSQFTTVKTSAMTRTATADLSDLDYDRSQVHLTATASFTVAADGNSMTGTIRVRNVEVNTPLGWISPGSCANIDKTITLTKVQ